MVGHSTRTKRGISLEYDFSFLDPPYDSKKMKGNPRSGWGYLYPTDEIIKVFQSVLEITKPNKIFEVGFYKGHSTALWAELFKGEIISCSPDHPMFRKWSPIIHKKYPHVKVFGEPSPNIGCFLQSQGYKSDYDLFFIDGNHDFHSVCLDITLAIKIFKGKWVFFDDYGLAAVRNAIKQFNLDLIKYKEYNMSDGKTMTLFRKI